MLISFLICFSAFWASFAMIRFSVHERHIVLWFPLCFPFFVPFFIWCHCHLFISVSELVLFVMEDTFGLRWWDCGRLYKICVVWVNLHIFQNVYHAKIYVFILFFAILYCVSCHEHFVVTEVSKQVSISYQGGSLYYCILTCREAVPYLYLNCYVWAMWDMRWFADRS